jgi:Flp pilus assembly protein TadD
MKRHRVFWVIAAVMALATALVIASREVRAPGPSTPDGLIERLGHDLTPAQIHTLINTTFACLAVDPQARRDNTRSLVKNVGWLAESGVHVSAETYFALGLYRAAQFDPRAAEQAYRKAIELRPAWSWPYNGLGILLHSLDRVPEAEQAFREAIHLDPNWSRAHNDLAILFRLTGRFSEAEEEALRAIELDPESVATHNNYGNLLVALERFDEAEAAYRKAISIEPDHPAPYYNLACLASLQSKREEVLALLLCAIEFDDAYRKEARTDSDFDTMRDDPAFQRLLINPE